MGNPQLFYTQVSVGKEGSWGSEAARVAIIPVRDPRFLPTAYRHIVDQALRGQPSAEYDLVAGPGEGNGSWSGEVYADTIPYFLLNTVGDDTPAGGPTFTHTIKSSAVPKSLSLEWAQNVQPYKMLGTYLSQLAFQFNAQDGLFTYSAQAMGKLGATVAQTSLSIGSVQSLAGWMISATVGGVAFSNYLMEGGITITRALRPVHGSKNVAGGTQDLVKLWPCQLSVQARLVFEFESTSEFALFQAATKDTVVLTMQRSASESIAFTMTNTGWRQAEYEVSDNIYRVVANVNGLYNSTDAGPCAIVITNAIASY